MRIEDLASQLNPGGWRPRRPLVAVIPLKGVIGSVARLRSGLSLAGTARRIEHAFSARGLKAVALAINSPGGSPVQSAMIMARIRSLAEEKDVPVYAFAEDVAASGGYMLALAADEIYADESSILGSIGVISAGFGFTDLIARLGIERRVYTSGERKDMLDPFRPENPGDVERLKAIQKVIHGHFKELVKERRGRRLKGSARKLFSGEFWAGRQALDLGLIDGIGDMRTVMRARFGERVRFRVFAGDRGWLRRRLRPATEETPLALGTWAEDLLTGLEARALWARFGL